MIKTTIKTNSISSAVSIYKCIFDPTQWDQAADSIRLARKKNGAIELFSTYTFSMSEQYILDEATEYSKAVNSVVLKVEKVSFKNVEEMMVA